MPDSGNVNMGQRIKSLRKKRGYSREDFANRIGISGKFLYEIETKSKWFSVKTLVRMAEEFGVSTDYILIGEDSHISDQQFFHAMEQLSPATLEKMRRLLEIAYELAKEEKHNDND